MLICKRQPVPSPVGCSCPRSLPSQPDRSERMNGPERMNGHLRNSGLGAPPLPPAGLHIAGARLPSRRAMAFVLSPSENGLGTCPGPAMRGIRWRFWSFRHRGPAPGPADLAALLEMPDTVVWVDIPDCGGEAVGVLRDIFGFHAIAVARCVERNHMSKVHVYPDHVFTVLHTPHIGERGHVHYVELDQFIGPNLLVTTHGPLSPKSPATWRTSTLVP